MRKFLMVGMILLTTTAAVTAQTKNDYNPYVNAGVSMQNDAVSYGGEVGIYNNASWYSLTVASTTYSPDNVWSVGAKGYWKISDRKQAHTVDAYAYGGLSMALISQHPLTIEPGLAAVWNVSKRFAPQISLGFPIEQNTVFRNRGLGISGGISLNYWIK